MRNNPLSTTSINTHIPALESRGISVSYSGGGGGSGGGIDLIVDTPSVSDSTLTAGQVFTLQATVRNQGSSLFDATTLHYYQSDDAIISSSDIRIGSDAIGWLFSSESSSESNNVYAPSRAGTYYYGACVAPVSRESNTDNNCSPGVRVTVSGDGSITNVDVPDANLRAVIADSLGKASDAPISKVEMASLNRLEASDKNIRDLTGLEFAINLTWLDLGQRFGNSNEISNLSLSPLSGLISLEWLDLSSNSISDVSALSGLTSLRWLNLEETRISDVSALSGLTSLRWLDLYYNSISDVSALSGLTSLVDLDLSYNSISDVSTLSGLTSLVELNLLSNSISDVSTLSGLTSLESLGLDDNSISDVSALSGLTSLKALSLSSTSISDVSALSGLTSLETLYLDDTSISDVSALSGLTSLERLWLSSTSISDITPLSGLTSLEWLFLSSTSISDITPLSGLTSLEWLDLSSNSISDLAPLVANTGLGSGDRVDVRNNPLSATSINTHIPVLQSRGVDVRSGASKPAVEKKEQDISGEMMELLGIEEWEAGDYIFRKRMEEGKGVVSQKSK